MSFRATHKCQHRFNKNRTICSVPCDAIDDNCAMYADEIGCKSYDIALLLPPVASLMSLVMAVFILLKLFINHLSGQGRQVTESTAVPMVDTEGDGKREEEQYNEFRAKENYGVILRDFLLYLDKVKNINLQRELCKKIYEMDKVQFKK